MMSASLPMMSAPLTATTLVIRQKTPIGVNWMIIIMIFMMTSSMQLISSAIFWPFSPAARTPAPRKMAMTMTGSMSEETIGCSRLDGKMFTMTCMTDGASLDSYSSAPRSAEGSGVKLPLKMLTRIRPMTTASAVVIM